ncbi:MULTISPECIES: response regulator [unclassified Pedobacter]|uniref:response regulator n=1 Tax=Pedobacter TaxID=84567 RepID=UPI0022478A80|nr:MULTISPECIES: response regulator transcription factor [unclassified Pedobacter]MCX2431400.1 response regulator transcription factor [Pedobacter sp. GR22-10]MCX2584997.1 response regulator transcription factor [Pedobacter sp. MR22-3]
MQPNKLKTAIVDDHPIVIEGLKNLLKNESNIELIGGFQDGESIMKYLESEKVDLILLDITLPDVNGMDLCLKIKKKYRSVIVLILSNRTERSIVVQTIQNGASGYLLKNSSLDELRLCIAEAVKGSICYSKEVTEILSRPSRNELLAAPRLTKREKQILELIAQGKTSQAIGEELFLSPLTIDTHRKNLLQKFQVKNVAELIMSANQQHLF